ncbi:MAG: hypothetical protein WBF39_18135, partial [Planococcus donghaensis]
SRLNSAGEYLKKVFKSESVNPLKCLMRDPSRHAAVTARSNYPIVYEWRKSKEIVSLLFHRYSAV